MHVCMYAPFLSLSHSLSLSVSLSLSLALSPLVPTCTGVRMYVCKQLCMYTYLPIYLSIYMVSPTFPRFPSRCIYTYSRLRSGNAHTLRSRWPMNLEILELSLTLHTPSIEGWGGLLFSILENNNPPPCCSPQNNNPPPLVVPCFLSEQQPPPLLVPPF